MTVEETEAEVTGSGQSKPTTPSSDGAEELAEHVGDINESEKDRGDQSASDTGGDCTGDDCTDIDAAEKEPLAGPSGNCSGKNTPGCATASASHSLDDLISEEDALDGKKFFDGESDGLATEDFESQVSDERSKKKWDVRCMVIGILVLLIIVAGAVAAVVAHRFQAPLLYELQFASMYSDGMVLQRAPQRAVVWGYGPILGENTTVKVTLEGQGITKDYYTQVKNAVEGQVWKVVFEEISESAGPYTISARLEIDNSQATSISNVLFGDIWICAGQFDLKFTLNQLYNTSENFGLSELRVFGMTPYKSNVPRYDVKHLQVPWMSLENISQQRLGYQAYFPELCYEYGRQLHLRLGYPVGLIAMPFVDSIIEEWAPHKALKHCGVSPKDSTSTVWHGMVSPSLNTAFYGMVWNQGELEAIQLTSSFNCTFVEFIGQWRNHSFRHTHGANDPHFPIGVIQLPPNRTSDHYAYKSFTDIRWGQTANYGLVPNEHMKKVFMAATMDLPEFINDTVKNDPSPLIVKRLLDGAMGVAYRRRNVTYLGPIPKSYKVLEGDQKLTIYFSNQDDKEAHLDRKSNNGFEVCCSDNPANLCLASFTKTPYALGREWLQAPILDHTSSSVTLSWEKCSGRHLVGVRYAWNDTPCPWKHCAIYDTFTELPMLPYIKQRLQTDGNTHKLALEQIHLF